MSLTAEQQLKLLELIWDKGEDGWVFLPWIEGGGVNEDKRGSAWRESRAFHWPNDRGEILSHLESHKKDDLYFTPNTFLGQGRTKDLTAEETTLYADLDEVNPKTDIENDLKPSIAWESSPGRYQAIWLLSGMHVGASERGGLNHRLSIYVGADKSGWDTTQLLRVPGRPNHKPKYRDEEGKPVPGKLLWWNPERRSPQYFESRIPHLPESELVIDIEDAEIEAVDRHRVWDRVRIKVPQSIREYMSMKKRQINGHDRSEVIWQIEKELANAGCTVAEIVALVLHTPWNKYSDRQNNGLDQLKNEAIKAKGESLSEAAEETLEETTYSGNRPKEPVWLTNIVERPIPRPNWLVRNIWTKGSCGFIAAEPKSYKSYFGLDMALSVATGEPFLNDPQFSTTQHPVLYLQEEDSPALVMHRLQQIIEGKSPDRHWHGQLHPRDDSFRDGVTGRPGVIWTPSTHTIPLALHVRSGFIASDPVWHAWLDDFIDEHDFALVIVDTLGTTLGDLSVTDDRLYTRVLNPLKEISNKNNCAVSIVHHNKKNPDPNGRRGQMMTGSGSFHAWTESALYMNKKEHVTGQPAEVNVERENKLSEDLKFRVRIPTMFNEQGHLQEGRRQIWQPSVYIGWGEPTTQEPERKSSNPIAGSTIVRMMGEMGKGWIPFDRINKVHGQNPSSTRKQLNNAEANQLVERDMANDTYQVKMSLAPVR